jgi:hypothetical protein
MRSPRGQLVQLEPKDDPLEPDCGGRRKVLCNSSKNGSFAHAPHSVIPAQAGIQAGLNRLMC